MFVVNDDLSIYATRGDIVALNVSATDDSTGGAYEFQPGDIVRIKIFGKKDAETVYVQKDFPVIAATDVVPILLTENDTKFGEVISKPKDYWYEIELNPYSNPQTIVGYDEDGPKVFKLFPEGKDLKDEPVEPEDIPIVDTDLDLTSSRPVENKAIARAVTLLRNALDTAQATLSGRISENRATGRELNEQIAVERARIDQFLTGATPDGAEVVDIRVGADGEVYTSAGTAVREQIKNVERIRNPYENTTLAYTDTQFNNLIDKSRMRPGYYVDTAGNLTAGNDWNVTQPISLMGIDKLYFSGGIGLTCFYKLDGTFISYVTAPSEVDVPEGAGYMVASIINDYLSSAMISKHRNVWYDDGFCVSGKKPYEEGFLSFTVPVNQTVSDNSVGASSVSEGNENIVDVDCIVKLPYAYTPTGRPSKLLMICHGAGKGVLDWKEHEGYKALVQKFNDRHYVVFDCNGFKNDALGWSFWGNHRGVEACKKAYEYVVRNYNVEHTFSIYGFSMGGLTAMNLAFQNTPNINCIALASPVINLKACWEDESLKPVLRVLYGFGDEWDESKVVGCNPYKNIVNINGEKHCFKNLPPIKMWYGSTEQSFGVDKKYAIDMVEAIVNSGGYAEYREVNGATHDICYGMNEYCNNDYTLFIERHNTTYDRK